jgi:hypothetical protein
MEVIIDTPDIDDPTKSFSLQIQISDDGVSWVNQSGIAWQGGPDAGLGIRDGNRHPRLSFDPHPYLGKRIKAILDIPQILNIGCEITVT